MSKQKIVYYSSLQKENFFVPWLDISDFGRTVMPQEGVTNFSSRVVPCENTNII